MKTQLDNPAEIRRNLSRPICACESLLLFQRSQHISQGLMGIGVWSPFWITGKETV